MKELSSMHVRQCEICGKRASRYVCQECGRQVCERCLEPHMWICSECYNRLRPKAPVMKPLSWSMPLKLFFLGFLLIFIGIVFIMITSIFFEVPISIGTVIFVGPIPIVLGAGPYSIWAIILAVALTALGIGLFILLRKQARKT